jgi:RNA polymerase-binding transcription factor DksA
MDAKRAKDQQPMIEAEERNAQARIDAALRKIAEYRESRKGAQTWEAAGDLNALARNLEQIAKDLFADGVCLRCGEPISRLMRDGDRLVRQRLRCGCRTSRTGGRG